MDRDALIGFAGVLALCLAFWVAIILFGTGVW